MKTMADSTKKSADAAVAQRIRRASLGKSLGCSPLPVAC
jgi:hypothetical protein